MEIRAREEEKAREERVMAKRETTKRERNRERETDQKERPQSQREINILINRSNYMKYKYGIWNIVGVDGIYQQGGIWPASKIL